MQLKEDQVRVTVVQVIVIDALVPIPTWEAMTVSDAKGTFVAWPKHLVSDRFVSSPKKPAPQPPLTPLQRVILSAFDTTLNVGLIPMHLAVGDKGADAFIESDDLKSLITPKSELTVACVQLFLRYLQHKLVYTGRRSMYGFLCPLQCHARATSAILRHEYISKRLVDTDIDCLIAPFLHEDRFHWQLAALCKKSHTVLFLCSLLYKVSTDCRSIMNSAMKT